MITEKNDPKTMTKVISRDCKCKFSSKTCYSDQKWHGETRQSKCKNYRKCKKGYSWNPSRCTCENSKNLKIITDTSVITCDDIISVMDIVSIKMTNTIAKNLLIISDDKEVRYCYILHTVLSVIILLLIITVICYHYAKHRSK